MNIHFYLERKKSQSGEQAIWCYVRDKKNTLYLNTKEKVKTEYWDNQLKRADEKRTKNRIIRSQLLGLNNYLNAYESKILDVIRNAKLNNFNAGFDEITIGIKKAFSNQSRSFFNDFDDFISSKIPYVSSGTIRKYKQAKNHLQLFEKDSSYKIDYSTIDALFIDKFYPYLIDNRNLIDNSANKIISYLKVFMNWAVERKLTENTAFKNFKIKFNKNDIIYLTEEELMILYDLEIYSDRLSRVRDIFCFQCFTGQRYSDVEKISRIDINNGVWKFRVSKTGEILEVPLNHYALSILSKYDDWPTPLPVLSNQKMNEYIKELCEIARIDTPVRNSKIQANRTIEEIKPKFKLIGTHTARRTFISLSLKKGMKPDYIMKIVGHSDYRMMKRYLAIENSDVINEMDATWGSSLRIVN